MRLTLTALLGIAILASCQSGNEDRIIEAQQKKIAELEGKLAVPASTETVKAVPDTPAPHNKNRKLHFPAGMFETYPQIIKYLFAEGSTQSEVRTILGRPEYTETQVEPVPNTGIKDDIDTWYYGKMILKFRNGVLDDLYNYENNPHCFYNYGISMADLHRSDIYIEKQWALHLFDNMNKARRDL